MRASRKRTTEQRVFFPWETRGGWVRRLGLGRVRPFVLVAVVGGGLVLIGARERERVGMRQTRASLLVVRGALDRYLADHEGGCPQSLGTLLGEGYVKRMPTDAWGRPFRLICPSRREGYRYQLMSDGPDGLAGGLDRIE